ncbi:MAG: hypothetical protein OEV40_11225, partial [Acidimicrobiia bacterium]|nr:hypothetical protein [Acidimicrobiia bacterium]
MVLSEETRRHLGDVDPPFLPEPTVQVRPEPTIPIVARALDLADRYRRQLFGICAIVVAGTVGLAYVARVDSPADPLRAAEGDRLSAFGPLIDDVSSPVDPREAGAATEGASNPNGPQAEQLQSLTSEAVDEERSTIPPSTIIGPT